MDFCATFETKFVTNKFKKSPNLVTLNWWSNDQQANLVLWTIRV